MLNKNVLKQNSFHHRFHSLLFVACCGDQVAPKRLENESQEISLVISETLLYVCAFT